MSGPEIVTPDHAKLVQDVALTVGVASMPLWAQYTALWLQFGAALIGLFLVVARWIDYLHDRKRRRDLSRLDIDLDSDGSV